MSTDSGLPDRAQVVIIGGGIVGASVAYHLTRLGRTDVVLIEQGQLSSGTTWHAAGLLGQLRATEGGTRLVQYSAQLYSELEAETGLATGFKRCGGVTVARTEDRMVQLRRTAATAEVYDLECELISPERAKELYPVVGDRGPGGRHLAAGRRHRQPGRRDGVAGPRRPRPWGPRLRAHPGHRRRPAGRPGHRGGDRPGPDRGRGGGQLRRPVGQGGGRAGRGQRAPPLGRALLRGVRADRGRPPRSAHPAGPRRLHLLQGGGGRPGDRRVRAGGQAVGGAGRAAVPLRVPAARRGLGPLLGPDGERAPADPGAAPHRDPEVLQRARELHPRQPVHPRRGARSWPNFFVGAGFNSVGIASAGGAGRALAEWIVEGRAHRRPGGAWTSGGSRRSTGTTSGCTTGWARSSACTTRSRGRTGNSSPPARSAARPRTTCWRRPAPSSARRWAGSGPTCSPRPATDAGARVHVGPAGLAALVGRRAATRPAPRSPCSTRRRSASCWSPAGTPSTVLQRLCTADVAVPVGRAVYTGMLNEPRRLRGRRHGHPPGPRPVPAGHRARPRSVRDLVVDRAARRARRARGRGRRLLVLRRLRGDGPALARAAAAADPCRSVGRGRSRSPPAGRSTSATRPCGPPASPTWASWAGSCTSRPSSPSGSTRHLLEAGADIAADDGRVLRDQLAAARQGVPGLRRRSHARPQPGGGRACGSPASSRPTSTSSAGRRWSGSWPRGRGAGWSRSGCDDPDVDDVGRRAGAARRRGGRAGDLGRPGRPRSGRASAWPTSGGRTGSR